MSRSPDLPLDRLIELRRRLHRHPECARDEERTAETMAEFFGSFRPDRVIRNLGGHGIAAVWKADTPGPRVLLRAELDGLPLVEETEIPYRSQIADTHHACGHDGHMTMLAGMAAILGEAPPPSGEIVLLLQPAEETGEGSLQVVTDPAFSSIRPDWAFAIHNLPGFAAGNVVVRSGCFAAGSAGLTVRLKGRTAHAAHPEQGASPAAAAARLVLDLERLGETTAEGGGIDLCTVIHVRVGGPAFGTTPGEAGILATVRSDDGDRLEALRSAAEAAARRHAEDAGLGWKCSWSEIFPPTVNHPDAVDHVRHAAAAAGLVIEERDVPFRWSEDFGHLTAACPGALIGLGAGLAHPPLHAPDYDFPDGLIPLGVRLLQEICARILAPARRSA
jgi:amidohydrolase